jgi:uncharacterized protein YeaO (DUF488 family)
MTRPSERDDKTKLDLQLEDELEATFPASDPLKITLFPAEGHRAAERARHGVELGAPDKVARGASKRRGNTNDAPMSNKIASDDIKLKRAYEPPASGDGVRILIDRLWPRGVRKADAAIDEWMKEIAPSTTLRKWFGHEPERWTEFQRRYRSEIEQHPEQLHRLRALAERGRITLVFSAHDDAHNDAVVLKTLLLAHPR